MKRTHLAIAVLIAATCVNGQADAARQQRSHFQAAVNNCQAALPSFEGAFRKRPLGIANEGGSAAFISCALSSEMSSSQGMDNVFVFLVNRGASTVDVSCVLIEGLASPFGSPIFFPKVFTMAAGQPAVGAWTSVNDNGGGFFHTASISCAIPPGIEINGTQASYDTDIGV